MRTQPALRPVATPPNPRPALRRPQATAPRARSIWDDLRAEGITPEDVRDWILRG